MSENEKNTQSRNFKYEEAITETQKNLNKNEAQSTEEIITTRKEIKYGETPYRWFFLVSYCLLNFTNQVQWVCFSAILTDFSRNYNKPQWKINMFSLIYMIVYPIF